MLRQALVAIGLAALGFPMVTFGQAPGYTYDQPEADEEGAYPYGGPDAAPESANVDVSVDLATPGAAVSFETFHDSLAPYGDWVVAGSYGRVWRPHVAVGWRPYYYGHWEWTDEGWLWVSDEPWGWAAYHYGRWAYDPFYGWVWAPGYQWAPAWVSWRFSGDVIGWAPLLPGFSVYVTSYPLVSSYWTFVPCARFVGVPAYTVAYGPAYAPRLWHTTTPAPPRTIHYGAAAPAWGGPAHTFVEQRVGRPIPAARVVPVSSPRAIASTARAGVVPIYRPEVRAVPTRSSVAGPAHTAPVAPMRPQAGFTPSPGERGAPAARPMRPQAGFTPSPGERAAPASPPMRPQAGFTPSAPPGERGAPPTRSYGAYRGPLAGDPGGGYRAAPPRYETAPSPRSQGGYGPARGGPPPAPAPRGGGRGGGGHAAAPAERHR